MSEPRILCVDDEPNVLDGLRRHLAMDFEVFTATSGGEGLDVLARSGPFAAVVSDMRMPIMDGAEFLRRAREAAPDTTRLLLTGQADMDSAIAAVNQGAIFRFLRKPCAPDELRAAIDAAVEQNRLVRAERELLALTLAGTVRLMTEVLQISAPLAFDRATHVRARVSFVVDALKLPDAWVFETAASLSQIGCVALPSELLTKAISGRVLTTPEQAEYDTHPQVAGRLLEGIPRLERVAEIVRGQRPARGAPRHPDPLVQLGVELLWAAIEVDRAAALCQPEARLIGQLRQKGSFVRPEIWDALLQYSSQKEQESVRMVVVRELTCQMVLDEDVRTPTGMVVVKQGHVVDTVAIERLRRFEVGAGLVQPFRVRVVE